MVVKPQHFLVNISVIEGRHFSWPNMDSAVLVRVANQKKCTSIRRSSDSPFFNEYFTFEYLKTLDELLDKHITFTVIQPKKCCRCKKILGYITLDVATVWEQPGHYFYHKWAIITAPLTDPTGGPRGYLKVDISILAKGETQKIPAGDVFEHDEIEGNLLMSEGGVTERQRANFVFCVYKGEGISKLKSNCCTDLIMQHEYERNPPNTFIQIRFVGMKVKTSIQKATRNPVWNEKLIISELFPPICQRIKIELHFSEPCTSKYFAVENLDLHSISNEGEKGFLPTFGPSFVYFYTNNVCIGKIFLSIKTELQENTFCIAKSIAVEPAPPISQDETVKYENVFLFCTILEASAIPKKYRKKPVSLELSFGSHADKIAQEEYAGSNCTQPQKLLTHNGIVWYLPIGEEKPYLAIIRSLPDAKRRMYNSNLIEKVAADIGAGLDQIEDLFHSAKSETTSKDVENLLLGTLDQLSAGCEKVIDLIQFGTTYNELDKNRLKFCIREMVSSPQINKHLLKQLLHDYWLNAKEEIIENSKTVYDARFKKRSLRSLENLLERLLLLINDPQDCWPDVTIGMFSGSNRVSSFAMPARDLVYSVVEEECGKFCGVPQSIILEVPTSRFESFRLKSDVVCKIDVILWLGLVRHKQHCFENLPPGLKISEEGTKKQKIIAEQQYFSCRAHIYQGRISPGLDETGLCDSYIRITAGQHAKQTQVKAATLNPFWDQTLLFQRVTFSGAKEFIKENPPVVLMEMFDRDKCNKVEFVGRTNIQPHIKIISDPYAEPLFPPELSWYGLYNGKELVAEVLAAIEFLQISGDAEDDQLHSPKEIVKIPSDIRPTLITYRVEILFWGVRDLKKVQFLKISKPKIIVELFNYELHSETLVHSKNCLNFSISHKFMDVELPNKESCMPPFCMSMYDCRSFGRYTYCGTNMTTIQNFFYFPLTEDVREQLVNGMFLFSTMSMKSNPIYSELKMPEMMENDVPNDNLEGVKTKSKETILEEAVEKQEKEKCSLKTCLKKLCGKKKRKPPRPGINRKRGSSLILLEEVIEDTDWWNKYYASIEEMEGIKHPHEKRHILKIYLDELEKQPEFDGFSDYLTSFPIYKGKRTGDDTVDEGNIMGVFKGAIRVYKWPPSDNLKYVTPNGLNLEDGAFQDFPSNEPLRFVVRVYCVKGISLRPKDLSGKSDPYICVAMGNQVVNDRKNYVPKHVNPVFGRCYELLGFFPQDHTVTISLWDWDRTSSDDLIGETKIDIENRFFTRHRAHCGLALDYETSGFCAWRDRQQPSKILEHLCKYHNIEEPEYADTHVRIGYKEFHHANFTSSENPAVDKEVLALATLHRWQELPLVGCHLLPEHVETRSLYHPSKPGVEQGKLQMWIDIFPVQDLPPPPQVDISPRKPVSYELRVIIWNTEDVVLDEDDFFLGEKKSDIYVKGWLDGPKDSQRTDVHYRSLTGEGNFNWRFLFPFDYLSMENKMVMYKKEGIFSIDETEFKIPCKLTLQVWDNDTISADDFLGVLTMELSRMPRGARSSKTCSLRVVDDNAPTINLFKIRRTKGWWPFKNVDKETNKEILTGKVEAEIELLTAEESAVNPVGIGREEPRALPPPHRPDVSFSWFRNPLKAMKYVFCKHFKKRILCALFVFLLVLMAVLAIYAFPEYTVKKILHA